MHLRYSRTQPQQGHVETCADHVALNHAKGMRHAATSPGTRERT